MVARVFLVLALLSVAPAASAADTARPSLRIVQTAPLKVAGRSFEPRERVTVIARTEDASPRRIVRATRTGAFTVSFADVQVRDRCSSDLFVQAVGDEGSRARAKMPQPQCPPALGPG